MRRAVLYLLVQVCCAVSLTAQAPTQAAARKDDPRLAGSGSGGTWKS